VEGRERGEEKGKDREGKGGENDLTDPNSWLHH